MTSIVSPATARAVVFDLDGTLIDSRDDIVAALNHALELHGRERLAPERIHGFVGDGARLLCARATSLPEYHADLDVVLDAFLDYYAAHPTDLTRWMPHALATLDALADVPLAICTNKPRRTTDLVIDSLGVRSRFSTTWAAGDSAHRKPSKEPVLDVARALGLSPAELVVVGDGPQDVAAGRAAGARTVGVEGGFQTRARLAAAGPDELIESLAELPALVRRWGA